MKIFSTALLLACAALSPQAWAEKADRNKPMNVEADVLRYDDLQVIATDHCPFCMKEGHLGYKLQKMRGKDDFSLIPNGAPGIETRLVSLFDIGVMQGKLSLNRFVQLTATTPAKLFGLFPKKGTIAVGSDADVVLFDPADGAQPFLHGEEAQRLLNVALSRAQAKLVLFVSPADAASPLLAPLVQRLRLAGDTRAVTPLLDLAREPSFPANTLGKRVQAGRHEGEVVRVSPDGRQFWLVNARTGAEQLIDADFWRQRARDAG